MECLRCGSEEVIQKVRTVDRGHADCEHDLRLKICRKPDALVFKEKMYGPIFADVCTACGYVMFSVSLEVARSFKAAANTGGR